MKIGSVVFCVSGRDKGKYMVILNSVDGFVFIADGKRRKIENPKRKNMKHVKNINLTLDASDFITNRKLRRTLGNITQVDID